MAVIRMNAEAFGRQMAETGTVLVEFHAPWCSYCRRIEPAVARVAERYGDRMVMAQVNIDEEPELTDREQIELVPTFVVYRDGKALGDLVAPDSQRQLERFLEKMLKK